MRTPAAQEIGLRPQFHGPGLALSVHCVGSEADALFALFLNFKRKWPVALMEYALAAIVFDSSRALARDIGV